MTARAMSRKLLGRASGWAATKMTLQPYLNCPDLMAGASGDGAIKSAPRLMVAHRPSAALRGWQLSGNYSNPLTKEYN